MVLVSIIIPTFNRWSYLKRAIDSVLNQTFTDFECIIIDDCSTQTEYMTNIICDDHRVVLIRLDQNLRAKYNARHAQGLTRNEGIKIAQGEYLAFLDDDDWWEPDKLEIQIKEINKHTVHMCSSNTYLHRKGKCKLYFPISKGIPQIITSKLNSRTNLIINSSVVIKKDLVNNVGGFRLIIYEDYDLWKRVMQFTNCVYIQHPLVHYDGDHGDGTYY